MGLNYFMGRVLFRTLFATYFRWRVYHPEQVPSNGPVILACNHASYFDPPLIGASLPRDVNYLARDTLFRFPVSRWILESVNCVPVDRQGGGGPGLKAIFDRLRAGGAILLFPEGTRSHNGELQPARAGIGLVVIKSTAPVVPVRVFGTYAAFGRHLRFPRPRPVAVRFGRPMHFDALRTEARTCPKPRLRQIYQQVAEEIMAAIAALQPHREVTRF
jgi:1-acyl-sn-glycerol-3-phosphate acyltransferase